MPETAAGRAQLAKEITRALNLLRIEGSQTNEDYGHYIADYLIGSGLDPLAEAWLRDYPPVRTDLGCARHIRCDDPTHEATR